MFDWDLFLKICKENNVPLSSEYKVPMLEENGVIRPMVPEDLCEALLSKKPDTLPMKEEAIEKKKGFEVDTPVGKLVAWASFDPDYPGVCVSLKRPDGTYIDLSCTEIEKETGEGRVFVWGDTSDEDYTDVTRFPKESLLKE